MRASQSIAKVRPPAIGANSPDYPPPEELPRFRLWLWLLLAAIFTHAVLPAGSPLHRTSGSAFSVTTIEVSLAPTRKGDESVRPDTESEDGNEESSEGGSAAVLPGEPPSRGFVSHASHPVPVHRAAAPRLPVLSPSAAPRAPPSI